MTYKFPIFANNELIDFIKIDLLDHGQRRFEIKVLDGPLMGEVFESWDYFSLLSKLRNSLDEGMLLGCVGAVENFYPSNMSLDMGLGKVGYIAELGKPATRESGAFVFDICSCPEKLATVKDQEKFHKKWLESL